MNMKCIEIRQATFLAGDDIAYSQKELYKSPKPNQIAKEWKIWNILWLLGVGGFFFFGGGGVSFDF